MKRIILFFAVCLGLSVFQTTGVVRAETSRHNNSNIRTSASSTRQKSEQNRPTAIRNNTKGQYQSQNNVQSKSVTTRQTVKNKTVSLPSTSSTPQKRIAVVPRNSQSTKTNTYKTNAKKATRTATTRKNIISRAANSDVLGAKIADIKSRNYTQCKNVYYDCMDEFCANKDANLRRCACSTRVHEFDDIKKQLNNVEDKMLDFNQRLLLVGLDKEDAAAVNVASEGELGFSTTDSSASEKVLKQITQNLNNSTGSTLDNNLSAISLSLDTDSIWDSIDSVSGVSTTSKTGIALYNAAQPVCVEMAKEVCSDDELDVIENNYKLAIQQDCNTVAKSYDAKYNQAIEKIHESSALLDMSRLNAYQQRNSDDILTCKKKILEKMYESSVCGEDLHKCLDVTGQYINPSDGSAFLSTSLYKITTLLTPPTNNSEKWSKMSQNEPFVSFLNSKKKFLEPATEQCQEIADTVWKDFLDDALAQIKLAQNAKLEQIRQSCTTLVAECKNAANQSIENFDARALSVFKVIADTTVNTMCENVQNSCIGLLNSYGGGGTEWAEGITDIATSVSYSSILETCMTVGKDCIIQQCNGTSGNFSLCGEYSSPQRRAILKRTACWQKVKDCVEQSSNLENIDTTSLTDAYYENFYGTTSNSLNRLCSSDNTKSCLITEQIWGNCEYNPENTIISTNPALTSSNIKTENKILMPKSSDNSTLLSWFAYNTDTIDALDSCGAYNCPIDYQYDSDLKLCKRMVTGDIQTNDGFNATTIDQIITIRLTAEQNTYKRTNFCENGKKSKDTFGNCCASGKTSNGICVPDDYVNNGTELPYNALFIQDAYCNAGTTTTENPRYYCEATVETDPGTGNPIYTIVATKKLSLYCITTSNSLSVSNTGVLNCRGFLVMIDQYGNYIKMPEANFPTMSFKSNQSTTCVYTFNNDAWGWNNISSCGPAVLPTDAEFMIKYTND